MDAGLESESDFKHAKSTGTTPNGNAREFLNGDWRNPSTPNQLLSTEISLEMNVDTKNKIKNNQSRKTSRDGHENRNDNRSVPKTHLHIIVFSCGCFNIFLLIDIHV